MEKICGIYKITCLSNSVVYIGQSVNILARWKAHFNQLKGNRHKNPYLQNMFSKFGITSFRFEIVETCTIDELDERERFWINAYGGVDSKLNCNFESGGHRLKRFSKELKEIQSKSHKGQRNSRETEFKKGSTPWNKGKKATPLACQHQSESHLGKKVSEETKKKISEKNKKIRGAMRYNAIKISIIDDQDNVLMTFDTIVDANKYIGGTGGNILKSIKKNRKYKGYRFKKGD